MADVGRIPPCHRLIKEERHTVGFESLAVLMDTHLSTEEIKSYLARTLRKNDFNRVGDHVHRCETCYQAFLGKLQERFPIVIDLDELAGMRGWHLEGRELAAYVEGRSDELDFECASLHLQECSSCMEKVSDAFEHTLEYPRSRRRASSKPSSFWNRRLPIFQITSLPRLRLAAAAVLLLALALIGWGLLQPKSEKSQLAGARPPETVFPDPSQPLTVPVQPAPSAGSDIGEKADESTPSQVLEKSEGRRQEDDFERALIAKNLTMPPTIEMLDRTPSISVRGNRAASQSFSIIRPFTTVISNDRPTFSWTALNGATSYAVSVYDADLHLVRTSESLIETQWLMPDRLEAGMVYTWMVTARKDGQEIIAPAAPARAEFKILEKSELMKLNRRINRTISHATRGVLYAEAGLLDEAEKEFQTHLELRPADERVKGLLRIVESWRVVR
jgi:hypothetical protein